MAFRFSLDAVLRFRESLEHSEETTLLLIVRQMVEAEQELQEVEAEQARIRGQLEKDLACTLPAAHLIDIAQRELELKGTADGLRVRLRQLEARRLTQLAVYQAVRRDRQVLSELRERQRYAYQLEQNRQDQKTLDDMFLVRTRGRE